MIISSVVLLMMGGLGRAVGVSCLQHGRQQRLGWVDNATYCAPWAVFCAFICTLENNEERSWLSWPVFWGVFSGFGCSMFMKCLMLGQTAFLT